MNYSAYARELFGEIRTALYSRTYTKRRRDMDGLRRNMRKYRLYTHLYHLWKSLQEKDIGIAEYLKRENIHTVAVYGTGELGKSCCEEMLGAKDVEAVCAIDRYATGTCCGLPIKGIEEVGEMCLDAIIITPVCNYYEIAESLYSRTPAKLISLEDILLVLSEEFL